MTKIMQCQKVRQAILTAPHLIPIYMEKPFNPILTRSILNKLVNRKFGLEIECYGSLMYPFYNITDRNVNTEEIRRMICDYYNIEEFAEDNTSGWASSKNNHNNLSEQKFNEHKFMVKDHTQLKGMYELLNDMKNHCRINTESGIHIHIDINDIMSRYNYMTDTGETNSDEINLRLHKIKDILTPRLDDIRKIFFNDEIDMGEYNGRGIGIRCKGYWVNIRTVDNSTNYTIEFRIAPQTFNYSTIMHWVTECTKIVNWVKVKIEKPEKPRIVEIEVDSTNEMIFWIKEITCCNNISETRVNIPLSIQITHKIIKGSSIVTIYKNKKWILNN